MAKEWKALWEDYDRDADPETTKSSGEASDKKWYYADGRDNEPEDEKDRTVLGFNTRYTEDSKAGGDYGGYGYSGYSGYGYYDEFDDSASDWYRRGKFRYTRQADYSPSSQFRSTFTRYTYTGSADADAKNKAIRALRTLTRSANTIVDKTAGNKQSFAVQFSGGSDSNGVSSSLTEDKQRIVFVSPDELLATASTEDEDAVVDALTGFVLLRVQIAQDVTPDTVRRINATGMHTAAFRAAEAVFVNKDKVEGIDAAAFGQTTADDYLAGLLAKSMLTRLARRNVVSNWGGFAPYFIRHAKKFAAVRENLEKAEKSVEVIVGTLGYNMLADESPLALSKEIDELVSKYLGAEVAPGELLDVCRKLVAEIRALLEKETPGSVPTGAMEKALTEMMQEAQAAQGGSGKESAEMRDFLEQIAEAMGSAENTSREVSKDRDGAAEGDAALLNDIKRNMSLDQLTKQLESWIKELDSAAQLCKDGQATAAAAKAHMAKSQLAYATSSRPQGVEALKALGDKNVAELLKQLPAHESFTGPGGEEAIKKLTELAKAVSEKAAEMVKKNRAKLKEETVEHIKKMAERLSSAMTKADETVEKIREAEKKIGTAPFGGADARAKGIAAMEQLKLMVNSFRERAAIAARDLPPKLETAEGSRSTSALQKSLSEAMGMTNHALAHAAHCFYDNYTLHQGELITKLTTELAREFADAECPVPSAVETAIDSTMASNSVTDNSFMASLVNSAMKNLLKDLIDNDADKIKKSAEDLGISVETLRRLINALRNLMSSGKTASRAEGLGTELAEKVESAQKEFSPVDRHLFGDKIETNTKILTGESIGHVNDEARNAAEEDYVAYLDHNDCKPKVITRKEEARSGYRSTTRGPEVVRGVRSKNKGAIERIRNALQFQSGKRTIETHGLRSGDLDEGSLHKLSYDCEHIWSQKTTSKLPDVAVGILVDQSGSMSGMKIQQARELCITLAEAVQKVAGVRLYVYGHTANIERDDVSIYEHYTPGMGRDLSKLGSIEAHCNNYDGYAIKDVAKRLSEDAAKRKYLFVIADGFPSGAGYGGETAQKHVTSVCKFTRDRLKVGTYAFAVGVNGHHQTAFKKQYGENHVVFVSDVMKCLPQIVRFLRNALQQERKLVSVDD